MTRTRTVYLLHFDPPYVAPIGNTGRDKVAGHYLGSTSGDVAERLAVHVAGQGSPLVRAAVAAGCNVTVARTWPGSKQDERRLKRRRNGRLLCPVCNPPAGASS